MNETLYPITFMGETDPIPDEYSVIGYIFNKDDKGTVVLLANDWKFMRKIGVGNCNQNKEEE